MYATSTLPPPPLAAQLEGGVVSSTGSVYQRRTDGRWVARLSIGGKRIARYAAGEPQMYSARCSIASQRRPSHSAAVPVVLLLANGSSTRFPCTVENATKNSASFTGIHVGCGAMLRARQDVSRRRSRSRTRHRARPRPPRPHPLSPRPWRGRPSSRLAATALQRTTSLRSVDPRLTHRAPSVAPRYPDGEQCCERHAADDADAADERSGELGADQLPIEHHA